MTETKTPLVSIALATYNGERYIEKQLQSILKQTYKNIEIVISDDSSKDDTLKIISKYKKTNSSIKVFRNKSNIGFLKNFEKAILRCKGKYIALCDQDDIWDKNKIKKHVKFLEKGFLLSASDSAVIDGNDDMISESLNKFQQFTIPDANDWYRYLVLNACIPGCTMVFNRSLVRKIVPIPKDAHAHDWWISLIAAKEGKINYIHEQLVYYRKHETNAIGAQKRNRFRINNFFRKNRLDAIKNQFAIAQKRIQLYIDEKLYNNKEEEEFLRNAFLYYSSFICDRRISVLKNGMKIFNYLYYKKNKAVSLLQLFIKVL